MLAVIPPELEAFIRDEVASGKYASADEAISEAVRLLREREIELSSLRREIQIGIDAIDRGELTEISTDEDRQRLLDDIQRQGRARLQMTQGNA
ncbi:MAG: hypothetical protein JWP89_5574 [Schlesneria sp.]|nr:hypothetical protein [Schlesneria sp.]